MRKLRFLRALAATTAISAMGVIGGIVPPAGAATEHCSGHTTEVKVESDASPATVQVVDTRMGDLVTVIVSISGADIANSSGDADVTLVGASWCIKSSTNTNSGSGTTGSSTSTNRQGKVQDVSYVVVYSVTTEDPTPPEPCDATTSSGGQGETITPHELGVSGPTSFVFEWTAFTIPDQFQVIYEGSTIFDTGLVSGGGSTIVLVPSGTSTQVTVRVNGPQAGTAWTYRVNCPV